MSNPKAKNLLKHQYIKAIQKKNPVGYLGYRKVLRKKQKKPPLSPLMKKFPL